MNKLSQNPRTILNVSIDDASCNTTREMTIARANAQLILVSNI
jgi:hypothetical protein